MIKIFLFMPKRGFTFLEILISTFILSLIMLGLVSVFISSKKLIYYSRSRVTAAELGRLFLDPLQLQVRQDTWNTTCLSLGNCTSITYGPTDGLDKNYTGTYTITTAPIANLTLVRAKTVINWTESDVP